MTDIFIYCSICNKEDGKETRARSVKVVNGTVVFLLDCGHCVVEQFKFQSDSDHKKQVISNCIGNFDEYMKDDKKSDKLWTE